MITRRRVRFQSWVAQTGVCVAIDVTTTNDVMWRRPANGHLRLKDSYPMRFMETGIAGAWVVDPTPHRDDRGQFQRAWCAKEFAEHGVDFVPVQANMAFGTAKGTIRGMHMQDATAIEAKLVRCTRGVVFDVVIDFRPESPTYGEWYGVELSAKNGRMLYVPGCCAHGCQTLEKQTEIHYMASEFFTPGAVRGFRFNDPVFAIQWPLAATAVSDQDRSWPLVDRQELRLTRQIFVGDNQFVE